MKKEEKFLKPIFIEATTIGDAWFQCLYKLIREKSAEYKIDKGSYEGQKRREFDYISVHIKHPGERPLAPIMPEGLASIVPPTTEDYIHQYLPYLLTSAKQPNEQYTYGERIVDPKAIINNQDVALNVNPLEKIINIYKSGNPGTNQATLEIAMPSDIILKDPPCLRLIDTRVRNGKLHFMVYFRSWDLWGGFPVNLGGIQLMKEYVASEIGIEDGEIIASSKGLHIYDHQWEMAEQLVHAKRKIED